MTTEQTNTNKRKRRKSERNPASYDDETVEFIQAIDVYRRRSGRSFPPWSEVLDIVRSLGYRKVEIVHATVEDAVIHTLTGPAQDPMEEVDPLDDED